MMQGECQLPVLIFDRWQCFHFQSMISKSFMGVKSFTSEYS